MTESSVDIAELLDAIKTDPHRSLEERETGISWAADMDTARVYSSQPAIMRRIAMHPESRIRWVEQPTPDFERVRVTGTSEPQQRFDGQPVYSLSASLPVACVTVKARPRGDSGHSRVVSDGVFAHDPRKGPRKDKDGGVSEDP